MNRDLISKKIIIVFVALLVVMMSFAACGEKPKSDTEPEGTKEDATGPMNTVTISIVCDALEAENADLMAEVSDGGVILAETEIEVEATKTVMDVLTETGVEFLESANMITSINGLESGAAGEMSGWLFTLNDEFPLDPINQVTVNNGDKIVFKYTVDGGEDVGLSFG